MAMDMVYIKESNLLKQERAIYFYNILVDFGFNHKYTKRFFLIIQSYIFYF